MVEKLDAGNILLQAETDIQATETAQSLHDRLAEMGADLIVETLELLFSGQLKSQPQDESAVTLTQND